MKRNAELPPNWKLPEEITRRLGSSTGKQRVIAEKDHLLIILHKVPEKHSNHRHSVFLWRNAEGVWDTSERGVGLLALDDCLDGYSTIEEELDAGYDNAVDAADFFSLLETITPIQRAIQNLSKTLQDARNLTNEELIDYRDKAEELHRNIELLYIDSKNALDYAVAKKTEEQSEMQRQALVAGHRLNIIMAIFLPITAMASLLGMNIPHGLEKSPNWVFAAVISIVVLLGFFMRSWVLKTHTKKRKDDS